MMILNGAMDFNLPLSNPVIIFSLVLFIILFAPILLNKIKIPHIIGLIVAGVVVGPYGLNLLKRDSSIVLFGTVGLLYIMFLAGLEIDLNEFKKNKGKVAFFGLITFTLPIVCGGLASYYVLGYGLLSSVLLASMFSTHTLVAYPIASRYGLARNKAVTLTIGGTMITDILALLILAAIAGMSKGEVTNAFWISLGVSSLAFAGIVFFVFPFIIRWFFKRFDDSVSQYVFVLAIIFLSAFLAEAAGLEAIIGAFFAGLVLNKFIPHLSPLMNRIDFVGNALFIPFFLLSVGMLVDVSVLVKGWGALKVAGVIITVAVSTKYIAAMITQKAFKLTKDEGLMMFGLSTSHAAATLAIILVGYNIITGETPDGEPIRLLNEDVLNGTILLILVSCTIGSFVVERASRNLVASEDNANTDTTKDEAQASEKILISIAYPETITELVDLGLMLKPAKSKTPIYALHIVSDENDGGASHATGNKMMDKAMMHAAATENTLVPLTRYDMNISNGISYTLREQQITDLLMGVHSGKNPKVFLGETAGRILKATSETIFIYKSVQPFNTLKRLVVAVTPNAELEPGFSHWLGKIFAISKEAALPVIFYANDETSAKIKGYNQQSSRPAVATFKHFENWADFLIFTSELKQDDLFLIVSSRKGHVSYNSYLERLPYNLSAYFQKNSYIILYPKQMEHGVKMEDIQHVDTTLIDTIAEQVEVVNRAGDYIRNVFRKKN